MAFSPEVALDYLRRAQEHNRLAHAYLIAGPPESGKRSLAANIAHLVNGAAAEQVLNGSAPDVYLTEPESKSRRILIAQIREMEHALQMRAGEGRRKVAIILEADRMMTQAANAFLKTLEEPPNNSLLLLLSAIPEQLPETVLSRCLALQLARAESTSRSREQESLLLLLNELGPKANGGVQQAFRLAQNVQRLLGQIRATIQDQHAAALKSEETRYKNTTDGAWLENREDHYKALTESRYVYARAQLLEVLFLWWGDVLRASAGVETRELKDSKRITESVAARLTTPEILRRLRRLEELRDHLGRNIQEALAIESAFLSVFLFHSPS